MSDSATDHDSDLPQIYLISPPQFELSAFPDLLARCLDTTEIACFRLTLATADEGRIARAADACREVTHARDVAIVIDRHLVLAERLGLDGVHLADGARGVRAARKALGDEAIIGAFCNGSRHEGLNAGEMGADYVSFGPIGASGLGDGRQVEPELFEWWSQMVEVPVVAEGALGVEAAEALAPHADFFGIGEEIWAQESPAEALLRFAGALGR